MNKGLGIRRKSLDFIQGTTKPPKFNHLLVIGIDHYSNEIRPLNNAVLDARAFQKLMEEKYAIKRTIALYNEEATSENILSAFDTLRASLTKNDNLIIYYSGHGELHNNRGYWLPVDSIGGKRHTYLPNHYVKDLLKDLKAFHVMVIVDACFSGSLLTQVRSHKKNRYYNMPSRWVMTSGQIEPVPDGDPGEHSPFARSLITQLRHAKKQYLSLGELWINMREGIVTNSRQTPACEPVRDVDHQGGEFYFIDQQLNESIANEEVSPAVGSVKVVNKIPRWMLIMIPVLLIATVVASIMINKATKVNSVNVVIEYPQVPTSYFQNLTVKENLSIGGLKDEILNKYVLTQDSGKVRGPSVGELNMVSATNSLIVNNSSGYDKPEQSLEEAGIASGDTIFIKEFEGLVSWIEEEDLWKKVTDTNSSEGPQEYLNQYPEGRYKDLAIAKFNNLEEETAWQSAVNINKPEAFQDYLNKYPEGLYKKEGLARKLELEEKAEWGSAQSINTSKAYQQYIGKYPEGKYMALALEKKRSREEKESRDLNNQKIEQLKKGLFASFDLSGSTKPEYDAINNKTASIRNRSCFKPPEINNIDWSGCSEDDPGAIITPSVKLSNEFSFCAWVHQGARQGSGWIIGQSGKRPDLGEAGARMYLGGDEENKGSRFNVSFLLPLKNGMLHLEHGPIPKSTWTFYVVTVAKDGTVIMYQNGKNVKRKKVSNYKPSGDKPMIIANGSTKPESYSHLAYRGGLKHIKVYKRTLSPQEVQDLYNKIL